ncbi:phospholipase/carboxylesterase [Filimonas lacunae]|uniref:Phospholipase/carboxylesterase n=1 Tax=Filimonas lacunae TaxID=477680 RepID=A0A173MG70_9BACT|nr:alpha/beta fold hydrolase [Filimonas lacunae]BAV06624.1 serine esterase [Filimonas lacunae]SIT27633.1 phospholipase/carboxylesterase [Filimonas lacunae]
MNNGRVMLAGLFLLVTVFVCKVEAMMNVTIKETGADSLVLQYLVREPQVKPAKHKAVILLHGVGSNEADLFALAEQLPPDYYIISARGPLTLGADRYAWYQVDFSTGKPVFNAQQEQSSRELIRRFMHQVKQKYQLAEVYLGGFSQGAIMSLSIGLTHPDEVQGVMALSGRLLEEVKPLVTASPALHQLKVFISHGTQDNTLPVTYAREAKAFLQPLQLPVSYHEYTGMGHQINASVLADLNGWLKQ